MGKHFFNGKSEREKEQEGDGRTHEVYLIHTNSSRGTVTAIELIYHELSWILFILCLMHRVRQKQVIEINGNVLYVCIFEDF